MPRFPKAGKTHQRLREAAETDHIAYLTQGFSAKRGRPRPVRSNLAQGPLRARWPAAGCPLQGLGWSAGWACGVGVSWAYGGGRGGAGAGLEGVSLCLDFGMAVAYVGWRKRIRQSKQRDA